ncbi:hypothetical protein MKX03_026693, partial [Papaver bracteatum]
EDYFQWKFHGYCRGSVGPIHSGSLAEGSSISSGGGFWEARKLQKRDPLATSSEELNRYYAEHEPSLTDLEE